MQVNMDCSAAICGSLPNARPALCNCAKSTHTHTHLVGFFVLSPSLCQLAVKPGKHFIGARGFPTRDVNLAMC